MNENKQLLIKTYLESERQLERIRLLVKNKEEEFQKLKNKVQLGETAILLYNEGLLIQPEIELDVSRLERIAAKADNLAARENSKQNSTPEAREINQQIENTYERVHKTEKQVTQLSMDIAYLEHEIDAIKQEQLEKREASINRLSVIYANIQQLREEASRIRFTNLTSFLDKQFNLTKSEIEYQNTQTLVLGYQQLINSLNSELSSIQDFSTSSIILQGELDKLQTTITRIPNHNDIIPQNILNTLNEKCQNSVNNIQDLEHKIMSSIETMAKGEDELDNQQKILRENLQLNDSLKNTLQKEDNSVIELINTIQTLKDKDANKIDDALNFISNLKKKIDKLKKENKYKEKDISKLKMGDITGILQTQSKSPILMIRNSVLKDLQDLNLLIDQLNIELISFNSQVIPEFFNK